jgi:TIR domain-containing protein
MTCDVFILHANKDKLAARAVEKALSDGGFDCNADDWDRRHPPKCRVAVLIFTRNVEDIVDTVGTVLYSGIPIVALLLESFNPSGKLEFYLKQRSVQKIPAFGAPIEQPWPQLAEALAHRVPRRVVLAPIEPPPIEPPVVITHSAPAKPPDTEHLKKPAKHEYPKAEPALPPITRPRDLVGFFSYSHYDDVSDFHPDSATGNLSHLKLLIQRELGALFGRKVVLWQDRSSIRDGAIWRQEILKGIKQAEFFIPVVTPHAITSEFCQYEYEQFLLREQEFNGQTRIFPLHYIDVSDWRGEHWLKSMEERQWFDWRHLRHSPGHDRQVKESASRFCKNIKEVLQSNPQTLESTPPLSPSETAASDGSGP